MVPCVAAVEVTARIEGIHHQVIDGKAGISVPDGYKKAYRRYSRNDHSGRASLMSTPLLLRLLEHRLLKCIRLICLRGCRRLYGEQERRVGSADQVSDTSADSIAGGNAFGALVTRRIVQNERRAPARPRCHGSS